MLKRLFLKIRNFIFSFYKKEILVLGDSHCNVFNNKLFTEFYESYYFKVINVGGATISGITNPNSKTQAMPIFKKNIQKFKGKKIISLIGEVDTGFVIWHKSQKYKQDPLEILSIALTNYYNYLLELKEQCFDYKCSVTNY